MKDNLIPFPVRPKSVNDSGETYNGELVSERRLIELRQAFDDARRDWPLEMSELPEQNRKYAGPYKR